MESGIASIGIALGLGLLVGLQREHLHSRIAGIRTFSLITVFGALMGILYEELENGWIVVAGLLAVTALLAVANILKRAEIEKPDPGQTTEVAALVMYGVGAYVVVGNMALAIVMGALVAILLYLKQFFREQISKLGEKDFRAIMVFVGVSLVVLPILPDETFGPYDVLNYREIWLMVVLIVGISIVGYFAYKIFGKTKGTGVNALLGGLISSTATTVTYAKQTKEARDITRLATFVIVAAAAVSFVRVLFEVAVVVPGGFATIAPPLLIVLVVIAIIALILYRRIAKTDVEPVPDPKNPAQFKTAVAFGFLYAAVILLVAFAKDTIGTGGMYAVSILSGLTDMDAITLSLSSMVQNGKLQASEAWSYILIAGLSNLCFKLGIVGVLGSRPLLKNVAPIIAVILVAGALVLLLW